MYFLFVGADPEPISMSCPGAAGVKVSEKLNSMVERATTLSLEHRYESVVWLLTELEAARSDGNKIALSENDRAENCTESDSNYPAHVMLTKSDSD